MKINVLGADINENILVIEDIEFDFSPFEPDIISYKETVFELNDKLDCSVEFTCLK